MIAMVALLIASDGAHVALWPGYVDDAAIEGLRPPAEVRAAMHSVSTQLASCARDDDAGDLVVDAEILAAGFVDRIATLSSSPNVDVACVSAALRAMSLKDRGKEPATHVVARFSFTTDASAPPGPPPRALAAALAPMHDDVTRCVAKAREHGGKDNGGSVLLHVKLDDRGTFVDVDASEGTLKNDDARNCIAQTLRALHVDKATQSSAVYVLRFDKPKAPAQRRSTGFLDQPTLFDVLGCGSAFH